MSSTASEPTRPPVSTTWLILGLGIAQLIGWGALVHMYSAFIKPMQAEFGWSSAQVTGALTLGLFVGDLVSIPVGTWLDRRGAHLLMTLGGALGAFLLALWSLVDSLWQLYAVWFGMGLAMGLALGNNSSAVITANVPDYRRALMLMAFLSGLAHSVMIPVAGILIDAYGWRIALQILAFVEFIGGGCICAVVLRGTVGSRQAPKGSKARIDDGPSPVRMAIRRKAFWALSIACAIHWFVSSFHTVHLLPLLQERGLPLESALSIVALSGPAAVAGRILLYVFDLNSSARNVGRVVFPSLVVALLVLIWSHTLGYWGMVAYAVMFGMASGVVVIVRQTSVVEIFGIRGFGALTGAITTVSIVPRTASPLTNSALHDWLGSYEPVLWLLAGLMVLSTIAFYIAAADRGSRS
jgi:MFS family permease